MKLPSLRLRLSPDGRCIRCGQGGYVEEKARLCLGCLNIGILEYERWKRAKLAEHNGNPNSRALLYYTHGVGVTK